MAEMLAETWRPVVGYEGWYEVSSSGRVRGLDREIRYIDGRVRSRKGMILRLQTNRSGYRTVGLSKNGPKGFLVHRLVLAAFVGPCPADMEGCHENGDPSDNSLSNLRWDTSSANKYDIVRHGNHHQAKKTHCKWGHPMGEGNVYLKNGVHRTCRTCATHPVASKGDPDFKYDGKTYNAKKTHCKRGHEFTPENTYRNGPTGRGCKTCNAHHSRQRRLKRMQARVEA